MDKVEKVKKLKQLLDEGIITQEDFSIQKQKIFGLSDNTKAEPTSLEDYEKELIQQANDNNNKEVNEQNNYNISFYERERLREKAKLDAREEIREEKQQKFKGKIHKATNNTKRIFKWILAVFCVIMGLGSFGASTEYGTIYIPIGIIFLLLGLMACPKVTDYTVRFEKYTKFKKTIVIILIVIFAILCNF